MVIIGPGAHAVIDCGFGPYLLQFWRVRGLILERGLVFETLPDRKVLEVMR